MAIDERIHAYVVKEETYPDKAVIVEEGSRGEWVFIILEGQVKLRKKVFNGVVTLGTLKEAGIFGETEFLGKKEEIRITSVVADGPVRVGILNSEQLARDYEAISPELKGLIRSLIKRLKFTTENVVAMVTKPK